MTEVIIFKLKQEEGYFDASGFDDSELSLVPEDTVCLSLENASITDAGISSLPRLKELRCIDLDSTKITDESMDVITSFTSLEEIWIEDVGITSKGFKKLALLPNLKYVSFWGTEISDDAYDYVMEKLPNLKSEG
ncbi:hypothetical protein [Teredinibacter turnerae]|uniref:hypothetical protein n=1 Tax=Teredinibacter turnerae TaxID=2426 RepID=UPI00036D577D|nr:hypothetical protein [Teredinibacter turnerae]